jgi:hypothetical protein
MKLNTALKIIRSLPMTEKSALSIAEILNKWNEGSINPKAETRSLQRYFQELTASDNPIIQKIETGNTPKYYLNLNHVAQWFLNDVVAFNLLTSKPAVANLLPDDSDLNIKEWYKVASDLNNNKPGLKKLRSCIRIVPDGLGRLPASIPHPVINTVLEGIMNNKQLVLDYIDAKGRASNKTISVQGLISKDGTLYLISTTGLNDAPRHLALHRVQKAEVSHFNHIDQPNFNLEKYIEDTQQLSHALTNHDPFQLTLKVDAEAIYHFKERPLASNQQISETKNLQGQIDYLVTANIPNTILLVPFLLSMGKWIEVLGPEEIRSSMFEQTSSMLQRYQN